MNHRLPLTRNLKYCRAEITLSRNLEPGEATLARGFYGRKFVDESLVHQHLSTGTLYRYPQVQFKVIEGKLFIVGLNQGAELVERLAQGETLELAEETVTVTESAVHTEAAIIGISEQVLPYRFVNPWLALNEENHRRFCQAGEDQCVGFTSGQIRILRSALIGNLLSLAKGVEFTVPEEIELEGLHLSTVDCSLKGNLMLGFIGRFVVNFLLPDFVGLGKSVSRGFGCVSMVQG